MDALNDVMGFDHVVLSDGRGNVRRVDVDSSALDGLHVDDMRLPDGWELLDGFSGQHGYDGPVMHESEFIGGGLERYIRANAGLYVAVIVWGDAAPECREDGDVIDGWAVAFRPLATNE